MSSALEKAKQQYRAGLYEKAVITLWKVGYGSNTKPERMRELLELSQRLRKLTDGQAQEDCEAHIARARRALATQEKLLAVRCAERRAYAAPRYPPALE